jgi:hypothetical protein
VRPRVDEYANAIVRAGRFGALFVADSRPAFTYGSVCPLPRRPPTDSVFDQARWREREVSEGEARSVPHWRRAVRLMVE